MTFFDFVLAHPFGVVLGLGVAVAIIAIGHAALFPRPEGRP
jgi:hypothetical protein